MDAQFHGVTKVSVSKIREHKRKNGDKFFVRDFVVEVYNGIDKQVFKLFSDNKQDLILK